VSVSDGRVRWKGRSYATGHHARRCAATSPPITQVHCHVSSGNPFDGRVRWRDRFHATGHYARPICRYLSTEDPYRSTRKLRGNPPPCTSVRILSNSYGWRISRADTCMYSGNSSPQVLRFSSNPATSKISLALEEGLENRPTGTHELPTTRVNARLVEPSDAQHTLSCCEQAPIRADRQRKKLASQLVDINLQAGTALQITQRRSLAQAATKSKYDQNLC